MDIVNVPVPTDRLIEVYRLLGGAPDVSATAPEKDQQPWTAGSLETTLRAASATIQGLARYLAEHPGEEITTTEVADALGLQFGWNSLAGALGAFGRRLANRGLSFPWATWYSPDDGKSRMMMEPDVAALVLEIL
jgi:Family of unknown function (DUF6416)